MPSYIELDKQASFPSASNAGKVIFGIDTLGQAVTVNDQGIVGSFTRPYKVFTALLTQSDGENPINITGGPLTIGVTYIIIDNGPVDWDFTNVGAPNNEINTLFIATGTTPANWGQNGYLRYNLGAPVATVLENTIGNIWFSYRGEGDYFVNSNELFTTDKTTISIDAHGQNGVPETIISYGQLTINEFRIFTNKNGSSDGILYKNTLEIRVYN